MNKLVVCIMGQDCQKTIKMCLESVKDADKIVYCDGGSSEDFWTYFTSITQDQEIDIIHNGYNQEDIQMNGKQRNFYLNHLKENYPDDWVLCLDADEVVEDLEKIKKLIQTAQPGVYSVKMRHFIGDFGHEDSTRQEHYVPNRLFKIGYADRYPLQEHPVLIPKNKEMIGTTKCTTIWHLAYIPNLWDFKKRYESHKRKSQIHSKKFLDEWYKAHLFGQYPKSQIALREIPEIILKEFGIDKDEFYFQNRGVEVKHFLMAKQWLDFFDNQEMPDYSYSPKVIEFGCGFGPYGVAIQNHDATYEGIEISNYAVRKNPYNLKIRQGDIQTHRPDDLYDICLCIDVLEHLSEEEVENALDNIKGISEMYIFSIPFIGDPNLEADSTHQTKKPKDWWINKIKSKGFKKLDTPKDWIFKDQTLIFTDGQEV